MFDPNNMKEYFRNIVTKRLDDAPVGPAKGELIEELSENLTCRYNDMVAAGVEQYEAQDRALEALGETAELVEYLKSLEPDQPLPELVTDPDKTDDGKLDDLLHNVEDLIRGALKKARTAIGEARENLKENLRSEAAPKAAPVGDESDLARIEDEMTETFEKMANLRGRIEADKEALSDMERQGGRGRRSGRDQGKDCRQEGGDRGHGGRIRCPGQRLRHSRRPVQHPGGAAGRG